MKPDWRTVSKWLLLVPTIVFSTLAAYIFIEFSTLDEFAIKSTSALHINSAPSLILRAITLLTVFLAISLWVLPPALAIGFALRARWLSCLQWGFTLSFLLLGAFAWTSDATIPIRGAVVCALILLTAEGLAWARRLLQSGKLIIVQAIVLFILFVPYLGALLFARKLPAEPRRVWSAVIQKETWQGMNTGSEYGATRQMVFAGDRIVLVFDDPEKSFYEGKQPMSTYRILSLDQATGAVRDQMEFKGLWGHMPYLYAAGDGTIFMQNGPATRLKPTLVAAEDLPARVPNTANTHSFTAFQDKCDQQAHFLSKDRLLSVGCGNIRLLNDEGKVIFERQNREGALTFAGANQLGTRFALQASEGRGDPSYLLYERFFIYDVSSLAPTAMISVTDLPERQSWSAFSPDGHYFALGNPNKLSMYELP